MTNKDYADLSPLAGEIVQDLLELIPNWKYVDLTKKGYNQQYAETIMDVAIYVVGREKSAIEKLAQL